jgi:hypothetical protein
MAVRKTKTGKYEVTFRGPDGRERQRTIANKAAAVKFEREQRLDVGRGVYTELQRDRRTVIQWATVYMAGLVHVTPKTMSRYVSIVRTHILPTRGKRRLDSIEHGE